ncbi:MAG: glycosyltransferase family 2 protein [Mycoplasma sp.]
MKKLLSIIIPIYNTPVKLFKQCLSSLEKNDLVEVILVNDCSQNKDILDFLNGIKSEYKIINLVENSGIGIARNIAMSESTGDYIIFLDSDDYFSDNSLTTILDTIKNESFDIFTFDYYISRDGKSTVNNSYITLEGKKIYSPVISCSKLFKNEFLLKNNILFQNSRLPSEDEYFWLKCLLNKPTLGSSDFCVMHYVKDNPDSVMSSMNIEKSVKSIAHYWDELSQEVLAKEQNQLIHDYFSGCVTFVMSTLNLKINKLISKEEYNTLRKRDLLILKKYMNRSIYKLFVILYYSNNILVTIPFNLIIKLLKSLGKKGFLRFGIKLA